MAPTKDSIVQLLLARAHSPDSANRIYTEKIQHRPVLLRPSSPPPSANAREARRKARKDKEKQRRKALKPKPLSARERRRLCLYEVPRDGQKYALFEPLHRLWLGYIREVLGKDIYKGSPEAVTKLASADFHGADVEVVRSGCVSRVGIRGIVIKDSRFTFEIITRKNRVKVVPKEGTMFRVEVPPPERDGEDGSAVASAQKNLVFEILGDQFSSRSTDRATKKFKTHFLPDI